MAQQFLDRIGGGSFCILPQRPGHERFAEMFWKFSGDELKFSEGTVEKTGGPARYPCF